MPSSSWFRVPCEGRQSAGLMLSLIVAMDRNRLIGADNGLPWRLPADLRNFRAMTLGKPIVMGRRTHESLGRALPGRINIVVTRNPGFVPRGEVRVAHSLCEALAQAGDAPEVVVIGGAELYRRVLPICDRIYLTEVQGEFEGDTWFPEWDRGEWRETERVEHPATDPHGIGCSFVILERKDSGNGARGLKRR